jgi:acyl-CoA synthetase (AMP-forming)/AMP-acid ligase II
MTENPAEVVRQVVSGNGYSDVFAICLGESAAGSVVDHERVALIDGDVRVTYGELVRRVMSGAASLTANGVRPGDFVGISTTRSIDAVITMLAVWAAGAAYCPVAGPEALSARALALLGAIVATSEDNTIQYPGVPVVSLGKIVGTDMTRIAESLAGRADLDAAPAYLMTTSGSSGEPKETVVTRGGLRAVFTALRTRLRDILPPEARWTHLHPLTFGYSVYEVLGSVVFGGELVLVRREDPLTLAHLAEVTTGDRPHVVCLTPSELTLLLDRARREDRPLPSHLVLSGEAAHKALLAEVFQSPGGRIPVVVNTYAATETSGQITANLVTPETVAAVLDGYVGEPLPGVTVTLRRARDGSVIPRLDTKSVGEIHVGGPTLAAGYLDFAQTQRRFLAPREGAGIEYATGDLGQWSELGGLRVVGRTSRMIKLGGRWLGMEAVERLIAQSGCVTEVAAFPGPLGAGGPDCLCLAVVAKPAWYGQQARLRQRIVRHLQQRVTVRLSVVDRLPRLSSGKVDTGLLARGSTADAPVSARGTAEVVRAQWETVLGAGVAVDVNLFELGVDSLGVATVAGRLSAALGRDVSAEFLLDHPRIDLQIARLTGGPADRRRTRVTAPLGADRARLRRQVRTEQRAEEGS